MSFIKHITIKDSDGVQSRDFNVNVENISYGETSVQASLDDLTSRVVALENFESTFEDTSLEKEDSKGSGSIAYNASSENSIGENAISLGTDNVATGASAISLGQENNAAGDSSAAIGYNNTVTGTASFVEGSENTIQTANNAHAEGYNNTITNNGAFAHVGGANSEAGGKYSFAHGNSANAENESSVSIGDHIVANYKNETVIGSYNSTSFDIGKEPAFVVGAGTDDENKFNAMTVYKDGVVNAKDFKTSNNNSIDNNSARIATNSSDILTIKNKIGTTDIGGDTITGAIDKLKKAAFDGEIEVYTNEVNLTTMASSNNAIRFGVDSSGNYGYFKPGDNTLIPFKKGGVDFSNIMFSPTAPTSPSSSLMGTVCIQTDRQFESIETADDLNTYFHEIRDITLSVSPINMFLSTSNKNYIYYINVVDNKNCLCEYDLYTNSIRIINDTITSKEGAALYYGAGKVFIIGGTSNPDGGTVNGFMEIVNVESGEKTRQLLFISSATYNKDNIKVSKYSDTEFAVLVQMNPTLTTTSNFYMYIVNCNNNTYQQMNMSFESNDMVFDMVGATVVSNRVKTSSESSKVIYVASGTNFYGFSDMTKKWRKIYYKTYGGTDKTIITLDNLRYRGVYVNDNTSSLDTYNFFGGMDANGQPSSLKKAITIGYQLKDYEYGIRSYSTCQSSYVLENINLQYNNLGKSVKFLSVISKNYQEKDIILDMDNEGHVKLFYFDNIHYIYNLPKYDKVLFLTNYPNNVNAAFKNFGDNLSINFTDAYQIKHVGNYVFLDKLSVYRCMLTSGSGFNDRDYSWVKISSNV